MRPNAISKTGQRILMLSDDERKALSDYQASGGSINTYLAKKAAGDIGHIRESLLQQCEREVVSIDAIFHRSDPVQTNLIVYRCLSVKETSPNEFVSPCYVGTTYEPNITLDEVTRNTNRKIVQEIQIEARQKAIFIPAYFPFDPFGESELLLPRDSYFQVLERGKMNGVIVEKVKLIRNKIIVFKNGEALNDKGGLT